MATGIHRSSYSSARPIQPNTTLAPLGLSPGTTIDVFLTGLATRAGLFTDAALINVLANPFVSDANAFYSYYVDPSAGDVDEQFSGAGIPSPYTLTAVLDLDPRLVSSSATIASLQGQITTEVAARIAADAAITAAGVPYDLGGSLTDGLQNGSQMVAYNRRILSIDGTLFAGYTATAVIAVYTSNAGTSVQAIMRNLTTAANVGSSSPSTALTPTIVSFTFPLVAGVNLYDLELLAGNASAFVYGSGYVQLTK